ncbi:dihydrofolate reductase [Microbacterium jejuense]|uniref:dihydrofolate reductase n=1 Tax=Microbacterium jejuense TaxID=1263637 RepID=UPI0031EF16E1
MTSRIGLIWAEAHDGIIGAAGGMPWHVPEDLAHFKAVTLGAPVVMGRRTWESFPARFRPLPGRRNIVVTRQSDWADAGAERVASLEAALALAGADDPEWIWVIGGGQLYGESMMFADRLEVTELDLDVAGDTRAPDRSGWIPAPDGQGEWQTSAAGIRYRFLSLMRAAAASQ